MKRFVALLRGINVGGNNIIKMAELKTCFEEMGFANVVTYIQSGNVLFDSNETDQLKLTQEIEKALSERFNYNSKAFLLSQQALIQIIKTAPDGFGIYPDEYRYDVIFLKPPLTAEEALSKIKTKEGVDFVTAGNGVLYFSRLSAMSGQSQMTKMIGTAIYKEMTIRNWNTTTKLAEL
ncbi:MAG TPA: DUF1697 domain-containing protein [Paludibacter sp.]|nr:DUF1697 domain-containing protein [Paludibacter sp.]